eukprot:2899126-Rhodomonas_salina.1
MPHEWRGSEEEEGTQRHLQLRTGAHRRRTHPHGFERHHHGCSGSVQPTRARPPVSTETCEPTD